MEDGAVNLDLTSTIFLAFVFCMAVFMFGCVWAAWRGEDDDE